MLKGEKNPHTKYLVPGAKFVCSPLIPFLILTAIRGTDYSPTFTLLSTSCSTLKIVSYDLYNVNGLHFILCLFAADTFQLLLRSLTITVHFPFSCLCMLVLTQNTEFSNLMHHFIFKSCLVLFMTYTISHVLISQYIFNLILILNLV